MYLQCYLCKRDYSGFLNRRIILYSHCKHSNRLRCPPSLCRLHQLVTWCKQNMFRTVFCFVTLDLDKTGTFQTCQRNAPYIYDIKLAEPVSQQVIEQIKRDVHEHLLVIFKNQGFISGERHVEISKWFGNLESTFYKHPKSPHPDVFRVSNDEREGCRNVGRTGWHIDGSFMKKPFGYSLYYMESVPKSGDTAFVSLNELIKSLTPDKRDRWERLWMISDRRAGVIHPLIYPHPVTRLSTLCFHLGMTEGFVCDYGTDRQTIMSEQETIRILEEIHNEIIKDDRRLIYSHKWEDGDFIISDNLAVGHEATPETQYPVSEVGLRVLHRTTIQGTNIPSKN